MMRYHQNNSTFIPKKTDLSDMSISVETSNILSEKNGEDLLSKIRVYEDRIHELEERLKEKTEEINALRKIDSNSNLQDLEKLNKALEHVNKENAKLREELNAQKEHTQLLYILLLILAIT